MIVKIFHMITRGFKGSEWGLKLLKQSLEEIKTPTKALYMLDKQIDEAKVSAHFDQPIFILSAGWRSGSTLLQRMLLKDPDLIIWGEPYHRSNLIDNMLNQLTPLQGEWPPKDYYVSNNNGNLSNQWVANCWPSVNHLKEAHLTYWNALFETPAKNLSKNKWGIKEVRWGARHVEYLKWVYPKAKFIFLCRDPRDAYASFFYYPRAAFLNWPDEVILTAKNYAKMWLTLVNEFSNLEDNGTGILVKYEDLTNPETQKKLECYLGTTISNPSKLSKLVKPGVEGMNKSTKTKYYVPKIEKFLLNFYLGNKIKKYGYDI